MSAGNKKKRAGKKPPAPPIDEANASAAPAEEKKIARATEGDRTAKPAQSSAVTTAMISSVTGIVAAMVLAMIANVFVARHYKRWDVTRGGLYTLSEATVQTLEGLSEPVKAYVLLPSGEPLALSVKHLFDAYKAHTSKLTVEVVDPDRRPAEFLALANKYWLDAEREEGRVVARAAMVLVRGDRHTILRPEELIEVDAEDELKQRPRIEQAITSALRSLLERDRPKVCFTTGHGELAAEPLREHLTRSGYEAVSIDRIEPQKKGAAPSFADCAALVIAGPTERVPDAEVSAYQAYFEANGAVLAAVGPQPDPSGQRYFDHGLGPLFAAAGIKLDSDFVFELDPKLRMSRGLGETFTPAPKPHALTQGLARAVARGLVPVMTVVGSIATTGGGSAAVAPLLVTSDKSFGMTDFFGWAKTGSPPLPGEGDKRGPLSVAVASELPAKQGSGKRHGGRLVLIGSSGVLQPANWQTDELRGTALFVEASIAWLTARPPLLDIPPKPAYSAGLRVTEEWLASTLRYVVVYMPVAALLIGVAVHLRRRADKRELPNKPGKKEGSA